MVTNESWFDLDNPEQAIWACEKLALHGISAWHKGRRVMFPVGREFADRVANVMRQALEFDPR